MFEPTPPRIPTNLERKHNRRRIAHSPANHLRLLRLKNAHRGRQCVVMATGPSLNQVDLTLIRDHPYVFGVNGAFRVRNRFRYYFCSCPSFYLSNERRIGEVQAERRFFSSHIPYRSGPSRVYLQLYEKKAIFRRGEFQPNLLRPLYWGPTVILDLVIPAALWMGFREIVLLGADYSLQDYRHFYPEAQHKTLAAVDCENEMSQAHASFRIVREHLERTGRPTRIVNCSPGSDLREFPILPLQDVIEEFRA